MKKRGADAGPRLDGALAEVERLLGKFTALASGAAVAIGALERRAPKELRRAGKDLHHAVSEAGASAASLAKAARRYARKHPWQTGSLVAAAGVVAALQASQLLRARTADVAGALAPGGTDPAPRRSRPRDGQAGAGL